MSGTVTVTVPRWALEYVLNFAVPDYPVPTLDGRKWISACEALGRALDAKTEMPEWRRAEIEAKKTGPRPTIGGGSWPILTDAADD